MHESLPMDCNTMPVTTSQNVPLLSNNYLMYMIPDMHMILGLKPVIQILCHVLARGWGCWLKYFTQGKAEVKYRTSARIRGPKHDTRFEWPVTILIMTRYPFLPFKLTKQVPNILVYLRSPAPFDSAVTARASPPNCEYTYLLLRSVDWWRHNIIFSIAPTIWILSECKLSTDNYVNY